MHSPSQATPDVEKISVLMVGQDNLFANLRECRTDYIPTGRTITPAGAKSRFRASRAVRALVQIARGKYDLIVLPAVDFRWTDDPTFLKRTMRRVVSFLLRQKPLAQALNALLSRKNTNVVVLDRYDSTDPLLDYLCCLTSARIYFKANLLEADRKRLYPVSKHGNCRFLHLPYWIPVERYEVPFCKDKDIDVFFAGSVNSEARRISIDQVNRLAAAGYTVKIVEGHLSFDEYLNLMSRSWLTLSPEGYGYSGFRHYESMLVGSLPLINRSHPPIVSDFADGQNCFLYSLQAGDLNQVIMSALRDKSNLLHLGRQLRRNVIRDHSPAGVARFILRHASDRYSIVQDRRVEIVL